MRQLTYSNIYSDGLTDLDSARRYERALARLRSDGTLTCHHMIDGRAVGGGSEFTRTDPADRRRVVACSFNADGDVVARAVSSARQAQKAWARLSPQERALIVGRLAPLLRADRECLAALISLEVGKPRADAVVEVDEAAVVVELSVQDYLDNDGFRVGLTKPAGAATAELAYRPHGVFAAIAPFNFPVAISLTQLVSALITGNAVVFKPSALTPGCGDAVYRACIEAGIPPGVLNLIHGDGATGAALAGADVDGIVFTGSAEVGIRLAGQLAAPPRTRPVIAEMGGKNAAIISSSVTDVSAAARAVARSAFGMTGQKCTACSRALVHDDVYDDFVTALVEETRTFVVGDPSDARASMGPVVSEASVDRFERAVSAAAAEGRIRAGGGLDREKGNFVELTIVDGLPKGHRLMREELFLPIVAVARVSSFDEAIEEANATEFGLSAGIFTEDETERERFLAEIEAGIVFVNHRGGATTGVWPGNQTMAGWKASGTTGKGGFGPHYIAQFVREQSRTVYESAGA